MKRYDKKKFIDAMKKEAYGWIDEFYYFYSPWSIFKCLCLFLIKKTSHFPSTIGR